jgi:hypothetical protein
MNVRNSPTDSYVSGAMKVLRTAAPILRPLLLAVLAVLVILVGLPALLSAQAAAL